MGNENIENIENIEKMVQIKVKATFGHTRWRFFI